MTFADSVRDIGPPTGAMGMIDRLLRNGTLGGTEAEYRHGAKSGKGESVETVRARLGLAST